jgi:quercetin dioxygenase-like cupin family protein
MIVRRWQAPIVPDKSQILSMYTAEGLEPSEEVIPERKEITTHQHPFDEVRTVIAGEMIVNVAGNKLLLRPGDRIIIPANTKHSYQAQGNEACVSFHALKTW